MGLGTSERTGTPLETRGLASGAGSAFEGLFQGNPGATGQVISGIGDPFRRLGMQAQQSLLGGFDPRMLGLGEAAQGLLQSPDDVVAGLFQAQQPFLERSLERDVAGLRSSFGQQGGRFSRNLLEAEGDLRNRRRGQIRQQRLGTQLGVREQQGTDLARILGALTGAEQVRGQQVNQLLAQILGFGQAGPPVIQQGLLPGLLQAGSNLGSAAILA